MSTNLESRYGSSRRRAQRPASFWITLAVIASVLSIAFVAWVQSDRSTAKPDFKDVSHELTSSDEVSLTFQVVKDPKATSVCAIKALNSERAPVGWTEVTVGPNNAEQGDSTVRQETTKVRVLSEATTVTVDNCWNISQK